MKNLIVFVLLMSVSCKLFSQDVEITWDFNKVTSPFPKDYSYSLGQKLDLTINKKLKPAEMRTFLEQTKIRVTDSAHTELVGKTSLAERIKKIPQHGQRIFDSLVVNGRINRLNFLSVTGQLKEGSQVTLLPYLGIADGKPVVENGTEVIITVKKGGVTAGQASSTIDLSGIDSRIRRDSTRIDVVENKVTDLVNKHDTDIRQVRNEINTVETNIGAAIAYSKLSPQERKKMQDRLSQLAQTISNPGDFADCPTCHDQLGDLIYDFRCKRLYRVDALMPSEKNGYRAIYKEVRDLSKVKIKAQELVKMKIIGINRYIYDVDVNVQDSIYGSESPALFNQFFSGNSDLFTDLISKGKAENFLYGKSKEEIESSFGEVEKAFQKFKEEYSKLQDKQVNAYMYCLQDNIPCCTDNDLKQYSYYADLLSNVLLVLNKTEVKYLSDVPSSTEILKQISEKQAKKDECKKNEKDRPGKIKQLEDQLAAAKPEEKAAITDKLNKAKNDGCDAESLSQLDSQIGDLQNKLPLRVTMDAMKASLPTLDQLRKLYLFDRNIVKDHYFYRLPPIYPQGDKLTIVIDMETKDSVIAANMGFMPTYHDELNLNFSVRNKSLFSFSSGPFFAFGKQLKTKTYGFNRIPSSGTSIDPNAKYRVVETGDGTLPLGLGAYGHIGTKVSRNVGVAGTIGVGYSFNLSSIMPAFMGGATLSFGDRQRLNISFGGAAVQVKELKENIYVGNIYDAAPQLEYNKPMRFGLFVGISYSIFTSTSKVNLFSKSKK